MKVFLCFHRISYIVYINCITHLTPALVADRSMTCAWSKPVPEAILTLALTNLPDSLTGLIPLVTVDAEEDSVAVSCNRSLVLTVIVDAAFIKGLTPNMLALNPGKGSI